MRRSHLIPLRGQQPIHAGSVLGHTMASSVYAVCVAVSSDPADDHGRAKRGPTEKID